MDESYKKELNERLDGISNSLHHHISDEEGKIEQLLKLQEEQNDVLQRHITNDMTAYTEIAPHIANIYALTHKMHKRYIKITVGSVLGLAALIGVLFLTI